MVVHQVCCTFPLLATLGLCLPFLRHSALYPRLPADYIPAQARACLALFPFRAPPVPHSCSPSPSRPVPAHAARSWLWLWVYRGLLLAIVSALCGWSTLRAFSGL